MLNRGNHRQPLFHGADDYAEFVALVAEAQSRFEVDLWGYCLMGNHWHLVAEVRQMQELSGWMHWLSTRHVRLFHRGRPQLGGGHIYQGRYKSFPIQDEAHLYDVLRYVEANPVRAGLVAHGGDWLWSSLCRKEIRQGLIPIERPKLQPWTRNADWEAHVDQPMDANRLQVIQQSVVRGTPYGAEEWVSQFVSKFGLETTVRLRGRPKKSVEQNP